MATAARKTFVTPEEYLAIERAAEIKSEYHDGQMYAMSGVTRLHNLISVNLIRKLGQQLEDRPCELYAIDLRVQVRETGLSTYPDIIITCEQPRFADGKLDTLLNPQVIFEVLSDSTEQYDRDGKFAHFRQIATLQEYVLVARKAPAVERYHRQADDTWTRTDIAWPDGTLTLDSVGVAISIREIYARVFPPDHLA